MTYAQEAAASAFPQAGIAWGAFSSRFAHIGKTTQEDRRDKTDARQRQPWAIRLRDGTQLCPDFQYGTCKREADLCTKGAHRCAALTKRDRVCGMPNHGAAQCRQG